MFFCSAEPADYEHPRTCLGQATNGTSVENARPDFVEFLGGVVVIFNVLEETDGEVEYLFQPRPFHSDHVLQYEGLWFDARDDLQNPEEDDASVISQAFA